MSSSKRQFFRCDFTPLIWAQWSLTIACPILRSTRSRSRRCGAASASLSASSSPSKAQPATTGCHPLTLRLALCQVSNGQRDGRRVEHCCRLLRPYPYVAHSVVYRFELSYLVENCAPNTECGCSSARGHIDDAHDADLDDERHREKVVVHSARRCVRRAALRAGGPVHWARLLLREVDLVLLHHLAHEHISVYASLATEGIELGTVAHTYTYYVFYVVYALSEDYILRQY